MPVLKTLYTLLLYLLAPLALLRLIWRERKRPDGLRRVGERFGLYGATDLASGSLWFHAVSMGEVLAAVPLIKAVLDKHPDADILVTTTTLTGSDQLKRSLGERVQHVYAPFDLPGSVRRFLEAVRPRVAVIMETELWPNILFECSRREIPSMVANARLSERSQRRYQRLSGFAQEMLQQITRVCAQNDDDASRFLALGLHKENLLVAGNLKFDSALGEEDRQRARILKQEWRGAERKIWLAASTHAGEDEQILAAHQRLRQQLDNTLLVLVPRHPERFQSVYSLCANSGMQVVRRSSGQAVNLDTDIVLGDSMGELKTLYGACDVAFVGGSLVPRGGQNIIEPASWALPVVSGPHMFNFAQVAAALLEVKGLTQVANVEELVATLKSLLADEELARERGEACYKVFESSQGAVAQHLAVLESLVA